MSDTPNTRTIKPLAAATHYRYMKDILENRALDLTDQLDTALAQIDQLQTELSHALGVIADYEEKASK